jgi:hypothetical protein
MTRIAVLAAAALLLAALVGVAAAGVIVADYRLTPDVLAPGGDGLLTVTIANGGGSLPGANASAGDPVVESVRLHTTDLTILSGEYSGIGLLGPGQAVPISFHVRAPSTSGIYFPEVWVRTAQGQTIRYPVVVNVGTQIGQLTKPALVLEKAVPDAVSPGDPFTVNLSVVNRGSAAATDVVLTVNASAQSLGLASPGTHYVARLGPGEAHPVTLAFTTDREVPLGLRTIGATLDYVLPDGTPRRQNESVAVLVRGRAALGLAALSTDPVRVERGQAFTLLARLENTGTDDANSVRTRIDLPFPGNTESFIGTVEPGNDAPAVFNLVANEAGTRSYNLSASYEDDEGLHTFSEPLTIEVAEPGGDWTLIGAGVLVLVLVAAAAVWYWRRRGT